MTSSASPARGGWLRIPLWQAYVVVGAIVTGLYVWVPPFQGNGPVINLLGVSSSIAILVGIRRNRPATRLPWQLFALGQFLYFLGDLYTYSYPKLFHTDVPFPSYGDGIYQGVYPPLLIGIVILARRRNPSRERATLIDSLILTVGLGLVSWLYLISPYVQDQTLTLLPKLVSIGYPAWDILLLAGAMRLAFDTGRRGTLSFGLMLGSIVSLLLTDFVYGRMILNGTYDHQLWLDVGWIAYLLLWGAAALHPSMRSLEEAVPEGESRLSWPRLAILTVASLLAPIFEVVVGGTSASVDTYVLIGASAGLFLLVLARMAVLVLQQERSVKRERALRGAGVALVAAAGRDDICAAALEATRTLAGAGYTARLCLMSGERLHLMHDDDAGVSGPLSAAATQRLLVAAGSPGQTPLGDEDRRELELLDVTRVIYVLPLEVRDQAGGILVAAGRSALSSGQYAALHALVTSVSLALESSVLSEDLHRRESEARFSSLVARSSDLITVVAGDGIVLYQSPSIERVLGYSTEEVVGRRIDNLLPEDERSKLLAVLTRGKATDSGPEAIECRMRHRDGRWLQFEVLHTNLLDDEHVRGIVLNSRDVSERKAFEEQLAHQAFHDSLTKLANRALFSDRVDHALARGLSEGRRTAVVFGDLDDFKTINDSLGHGAGDEVLMEVAHRLAATVRPTDTAARFGGDEFAVLLEGIETREDATEVAERVLEAMEAPVRIGDTEVFVRTSIGIAITEVGERSSPAELLRNADVAMYIAKRDGKGAYRVFEESMHTEALERLEMRADLQRAIDGDQFELHFQPVVRLNDRTISGVEALVRWHHPSRGVVGPTTFIPVAEEMGLIIPIGQWVFAEACRRAIELQAQFPCDPPLTMAVNLSPRQLNQGDIVGDVRRAILDSGVDPRTLVIEITESLMMTDADLAIERLLEMKALGVRLAMDDFGTGYSSLSYLSRFPVDILKMDRSFLEAGAAPDSGLAAAVVALGETLSLQVVAEGIELATQMDSLRELGCELGQGFLFAEPMNISSMRRFLNDARTSSSVFRLPPPEAQPDAA